MDWKANDRFNFRELSNTPRDPLEGSSNTMENVLKTIASPFLDTQKSRCSGRIVRATDRFMFLGEVIFDEHDLDPSSYNKVICDKDSENWRSSMKVEMESMYSNHV